MRSPGNTVRQFVPIVLLGLLHGLLPGTIAHSKQRFDTQERSANATKTKAEAETQRRKDLLDAAIAEAAHFSPPTLAYVQWLVANGYSRISRERENVVTMLAAAFTTAQGTEPPELRSQLQTRILQQLVTYDPQKALSLTSGADTSTKTFVSSLIAMQTIRQNKFEEAQAMIEAMTAQGEFPYYLGVQFLQAVGKNDPHRLSWVFLLAYRSYKQHDHTGVRFGGEDFPSMTRHFWQSLPPDVATEVIEEILAQAKRDASSEPITDPDNPALTFSSVLEYRVFQLLPILRAVNPRRAEAMRLEAPRVLALLQQAAEAPRATAKERGAAESGAGTETSPSPLATNALKQQLENAEGLPIQSQGRYPRLEALKSLVAVATPGDTDISRQALKAMAKAMEDVVAPAAIDYYFFLAQNWHQLGDDASAQEFARKGVRSAVEYVGKRGRDDDRNRAPVAFWPEELKVRRFIKLANDISPEAAMELLAGVGNLEIKTLETVVLVNSWLGVPDLRITALISQDKTSVGLDVRR